MGNETFYWDGLMVIKFVTPARVLPFSVLELNNNTAHRTHNITVSWFIPLQSDSQTLTKLDGKTSKENPRSQSVYDSSSSSLLSTHVLITLFGSPSPNLVVLPNVTKLWGVGLVKLSYILSSLSFFFDFPRSRMRVNSLSFHILGLGWFHSTDHRSSIRTIFLTRHIMWHT